MNVHALVRRWARKQTKQALSDTLLMYYFATRVNKAGYFWPSVETIARDCCMTPRNVYRGLARLKKARAIQKHGHVKGVCKYSFGVALHDDNLSVVPCQSVSKPLTSSQTEDPKNFHRRSISTLATQSCGGGTDVTLKANRTKAKATHTLDDIDTTPRAPNLELLYQKVPVSRKKETIVLFWKQCVSEHVTDGKLVVDLLAKDKACLWTICKKLHEQWDDVLGLIELCVRKWGTYRERVMTEKDVFMGPKPRPLVLLAHLDVALELWQLTAKKKAKAESVPKKTVVPTVAPAMPVPDVAHSPQLTPEEAAAMWDKMMEGASVGSE